MTEAEKPDNRIDVLSKVDDFMHRRRARMADPLPMSSPQIEPVDDIPLLTEVVTNENKPALAIPAEAGATKSLRDIDADIARELDIWLDENLPQVVMYVMDGITDKLIRQIHESVREDMLPRLRRALDGNAEPGKQ